MSFGDNGKWHYVGSNPVDSGTMMLVDPCYVLPDERDRDKDNYILLEYGEALGFNHPTDHPESYESRRRATEKGDYNAAYSLGGRGNTMGFFFDTNFGDGMYPVYARIGEDNRVTGIFIDFGDHDEDPDEWEVEDELESVR